ncbi:MAG TPA: hypothetical protein PLI62_02415 [Spirochaetota bacterium]|nr:hypothetical protein [Spirochaetota bacterium]
MTMLIRRRDGAKAGVTPHIILVGIALCVVAAFSCRGKSEMNVPGGESNTTGSVETRSNPDYSGVYRIADEKICNLTITVRKNEHGYMYLIKGTGVKSSGKLAVEKDGEQVYLTFTGMLRSGDRSPVTGAYSGNTITIQNYGNSMNEYVCFKQCDGKYLRLRR